MVVQKMCVTIVLFLVINTSFCFALHVEPKTKPNPGIVNQNGHDCFFSSSMQILTNIPQLDSIFASDHYVEDSIPGQWLRFQNELRKATQALGTNGSYGSRALRGYITDKNREDNIFIQYMGAEQQDAQEFLSNLLQILTQTGKTPKENKAVEKKLKDIFDCLTQSKINCSKCNKTVSTKINDNWLFSLPIKNSNESIPLKELVQNFFVDENLEECTCENCKEKYVYEPEYASGAENKWKCTICNKQISVKFESLKDFLEFTCDHSTLGKENTNFYFTKTPIITKKSSLFQLPQILVLSPKRFKFEGLANRINTPVSCEEKITLQDKSGDVSFELIGVVLHFGDIKGGHYKANVKDSHDQKWYHYDDTSRTDTNIVKVTEASEYPYIYFYQRIDEPKDPLTEKLTTLKQSLKKLKKKLGKLRDRLGELRAKL